MNKAKGEGVVRGITHLHPVNFGLRRTRKGKPRRAAATRPCLDGAPRHGFVKFGGGLAFGLLLRVYGPPALMNVRLPRSAARAQPRKASSCLSRWHSTACAPTTSSLLPILLILPNRVLPPLAFCFGVCLGTAAKSRGPQNWVMPPAPSVTDNKSRDILRMDGAPLWVEL